MKKFVVVVGVILALSLLLTAIMGRFFDNLTLVSAFVGIPFLIINYLVGRGKRTVATYAKNKADKKARRIEFEEEKRKKAEREANCTLYDAMGVSYLVKKRIPEDIVAKLQSIKCSTLTADKINTFQQGLAMYIAFESSAEREALKEVESRYSHWTNIPRDEYDLLNERKQMKEIDGAVKYLREIFPETQQTPRQNDEEENEDVDDCLKPLPDSFRDLRKEKDDDDSFKPLPNSFREWK